MNKYLVQSGPKNVLFSYEFQFWSTSFLREYQIGYWSNVGRFVELDNYLDPDIIEETPY